jgi:hypothetical protein
VKGVPFAKFGGFVHPSDLPMAGGGTYTSGGLTLRDWFAGQALAGIATRQNFRGIEHSAAAQAYVIADAMLAEGSKE